MTATVRLVATFVMLLSFAGCREATPTSALPVVPVRIGQQTFHLEVVANDADRQKGLMYRESMPADGGMIFVFPEEAVRSFWMKNTKIPLDILYLNSIGGIVSIRHLKPLDESPVSSEFPAKFAIELNEGAAEKAGVKVGFVVNIPPVARHAEE